MPSFRTPIMLLITAVLSYTFAVMQCSTSVSNGLGSGPLPHLPPVGRIGQQTPTGSAESSPGALEASLETNETHGSLMVGRAANTSRKFGYIVLTSEKHHNSRIPLLMRTWGKHANIMFIASDKADANNKLIVDLQETGKETLGRKAMKMLRMTCSEVENLDFVVMADDDTYLVTPNLEHIIGVLDPEVPRYMGYSLTHTKVPFIGGGGGIVFSRGAMRGLCKRADQSGHQCNWRVYGKGMPGDIAVSLCMQQLKVPAKHVHGFHPFPVHSMVDQPKNWCTETWWIPKHMKCPPVPYAISFHYLPPERWNEVYYWTYTYARVGPPLGPNAKG